MPSRGEAFGGLVWALSLQLVVVAQVVASAWPRAYSFWNNYISDLGNTACHLATNPDGTTRYVCSPWHGAMDTSFVVLGLLVVAGAVLTRHAWPYRRLSHAGLVLVGLAGLCVIVIGLNPENVRYWVHGITAAVELPAQNVGMFLLGLTVWRQRRAVAVLSMACGGVGCVATALYFSQSYLGLGVGAMERLAAYPAILWLFVVGVSLLSARVLRSAWLRAAR